ncbi:MAG: nucleotidyltransferase domain-containing protein [Dehalococcoidales bacterium]|nr:nucleotidyltransferase domain-containing protein [Dehalococcoidales bacterium]
MGKFFYLDNPQAENRTERLIEQAVEDIKSFFGEQVRAIFLVGSMARGEGAWKKFGDGLNITSDVDLLIITTGTTSVPAKLRARLDNLGHQAKIEVALWIKSVFSMRMSGPTIDICDIKETGKILYGDGSVLDTLEFNPADIKFEEAVFLFFNRAMLTVLECSPADFNSDTVEAKQRLSLCAAAIMATCTDIITISNGKYSPSPIKRAELVKSMINGIDADIDKEKFLQDLSTAFKFKMESPEELYIANAYELWEKTRGYLMNLFRFYFKKKYGGDDFTSYPHLVDRNRTISKRIIGVLSSFKRASVLIRNGKMPRHCPNISNLFYGKMVALYLFLALDKQLDEQHINRARSYLSHVYCFTSKSDDLAATWLNLRDRLRDLHERMGVI